MILAVLILWILIKLQAPAWCYILLGGFTLLQMLEFILHLLEKRLEKVNEELERHRKLQELGGR